MLYMTKNYINIKYKYKLFEGYLKFPWTCILLKSLVYDNNLPR